MRRLAFACVLLAACRGPRTTQPALPAVGISRLEPGPYLVGLSVFIERDSSRPSLPTDDAPAIDGRPMQIVVWYPADVSSRPSVSLRDYVQLSAGALGGTRDETAARARKIGEFVRTPLSNGITQSAIDSVLDAPMNAARDAPPAGRRFPLVVFLHTTPWGASVMSEYLASHGFVVAAIESKGEREAAYRLSRENLDAMVRDAAFTVARMRREPYVDERLGLIGMSNGSIAAVALELSGIVGRAVVSLDGGIGERAGGTYLGERSSGVPTKFTVPILHLYSPNNPALDFQYLRSYESATRTLVRVGQLRHGDFLTGGALERLMPGAFGNAPPDATTGFETVCRYTKNFLAWHLTADSAGARYIAASPESIGAPVGLLTIERLAARAGLPR